MTTTDLPIAAGRYCRIEFGAQASQIAYITKVKKTGNLWVRAFNASRGEYYPTARTIAPGVVIAGPWDAPPAGVPAFPG